MTDLVRFGVAMERELLRRFDERIARRGYENRSEALRDLVRADLTRAAWEGDAVVAGTLTLVYGRRQREHVVRALDAEAARTATGPEGTGGASRVVSTMHVALDETRGMEVVVVRGRASELSALAGRIGGTRGVLAAELTIAAVAEP